jgi:AbiV family abortive infection protein
MSKKLDAYKGPLSPAQVAEGMTAALANAARLASDAEAMLERGSNATAVSLAALSIEEAGKVSILRSLALAVTPEEARARWKDYRTHTRKNVAWILPALVAGGARTLDALRPLVDETSDHPEILDQIKQLGFYTDCLGKAHWSVPTDVINLDLAKGIVNIARVFARPHVVTAREVELWIHHVGPVQSKDMSIQKQAVVAWQQAMHAEGLSSTTADAMRQFLDGAASEGV